MIKRILIWLGLKAPDTKKTKKNDDGSVEYRINQLRKQLDDDYIKQQEIKDKYYHE